MSRPDPYAFTLPDQDPDLADLDSPGTGAGEDQDVVPGLRPDPGPGTRTGQPRTAPAGSGNHGQNHPGGSGTGSQNQAASPPAEGPERVSAWEAAWLAVLAWAKRSAQDHRRHRSFWHWVWNGLVKTQPDTLLQFVRYVRSDSWLMDYMTGWVRTVAKWEYRAYALLIGGPLVEFGNCISRTGARQSRFWLVFTVALLAFCVWLLRH